MAPLSLVELLDAAIGTPEAGAVNFNALHSLLLAMLQHMGLQPPPAPPPGEQPQKRGQLVAPSPAATDTEQVEGEEEEEEVKIEAKDDDDSKARSLSQDLLEELDGVKAVQSQMEEDIQMIKGMLGMVDGQDAAGQQRGHRDRARSDSDSARPWAHLEPVPETDVDQPTSRDSSESGDDTQRKDSSKGAAGGQGAQPPPRASKGTARTQPSAPGTAVRKRRASVTSETWAATASDEAGRAGGSATAPRTQPGSPGTQTSTPGTQPGSPGTQPGSPGTQTSTPGTQPGSPGTQPGSPDTQATTPGTQPAPPLSQGGAAGAQPSTGPGLDGAPPVPSAALSSAPGTGAGATRPKDTGEALQPLSPTTQGPQTAAADSSSVSPAQGLAVPGGFGPDVGTAEALGQLGQLCDALRKRVAQLEATKLDRAELEELRRLLPEGGHVPAGQQSISSVLADLQGSVASLQGLASDLQGEKEKVKQLQDAFGKLGVAGADGKVDGSQQLGAMLQQLRKELKELREQQNAARTVLEQLVANVASHLQGQLDELRSMVGSAGPPGTSPPDSTGSTEQEQEQEQAACPVCSTDVGLQLGQLLQRYEQLQELVESVAARQAMGKASRQRPDSRQDEELLKHIQATIAQVQGDCEKFSSIMGNLMDDRHQKQRDIEALFQALERLEREKAGKEEMVLEIDVKADRAALAGKVSCAQFDAAMEQLNKMIEEMLSKVMGQEQDWQQIQQKLIGELDSKLDRLELAPLRQQLEERWRSAVQQLKEKAPQEEGDDAAGIRKQLLAHFHCVSCDRPLHMLVPGPHIVTIPPLPPLPSRITMRPHAIFEPEQLQQHGQREQMTRCGYLRVPRRCGGQHTITHPLQRCPRPPHLPPCAPGHLQPLSSFSKEHLEMELLGQDGHIYKGRWDTRLPTLAGKEGSLRDKPKPSPRQWDAQDLLRLRPQSATSPLSQPGTPRLQEQRPASSHLPHLWPACVRGQSPTAERGQGTLAENPLLAPGRPAGCGQEQ